MEKDKIKFLQQDDIHLFYEMMYQSLKTDNVIDGMGVSISLLRASLNSGNVVLYRKEANDKYVTYINDESVQKVISSITPIINQTSAVVENKGYLVMNFELSEMFKNMLLLHIDTSDNNYILLINNFTNEIGAQFLTELKKTLQVILKRAELYEVNVKSINTDLLTGLDNRNSYETKIKKFNKNDDNLVYGLFDLFRLKYINDNYSHELGDDYIRQTAKVLNKYWPKYRVDTINGIEKKIETGNCVYRIGGDEFALLAKNENIELTKMKASLAAEEIHMTSLGVFLDSPLGLNYGIVEHAIGDELKNAYINADNLMAKDKEKMYVKYNINRRQ